MILNAKNGYVLACLYLLFLSGLVGQVVVFDDNIDSVRLLPRNHSTKVEELRRMHSTKVEL